MEKENTYEITLQRVINWLDRNGKSNNIPWVLSVKLYIKLNENNKRK